MQGIRPWTWAPVCLLVAAAPAWAATVTIEYNGKAPFELGSTIYFLGKIDGVGKAMNFSVNGIPGGNAAVGTVNSQNGKYVAPAAMPPGNAVTITATSTTTPVVSGSITLPLRVAGPAIASLSPRSIQCGQPYTLTVNGSHYAADSIVWVNGAAVPTTFVSGSTVIAKGVGPQSTGIVGVKVVNKSTGSSPENYQLTVQPCGTQTPPPTTPPTTPPPTTPPSTPNPTPDAALVAATRLLEQASFGPTPAEVAQVRAIGANAWLTQQFAMAPSPMPVADSLNTLGVNWYRNMASGKDQLRQRMIFALSQIFVVSATKNPYANEMQPWLTTLNKHAFGNFNNLLREMSLNPSMGKYLDLGNSVMPSPNENYAREIMQLFTIGTYLLNQDGSPQLDRYGEPIPTYDQAAIGEYARALSGWTYPGNSATGINWENFSGPLQPRDAYHDKGAKTLLNGGHIPAGQGAQADFNAVMDNLFQHPNLPPFVATRLIRAFVTSNPSPAYIKRVADVFAYGPAGRGDLAATLRAVLTDPEARSDAPSALAGKLKDPMLHTLGMIRALNGQVLNPTNMFWNYQNVNQEILRSPSVFNFYSPLARLPGSPELYGPEFQIYAPSLSVTRANFMYDLLAGNLANQAKIDLTPYVTAAKDPAALIKLVDTNLLAGRMRPATRAALATALTKISDPRERAITVLYLSAVTDFAVHQ